jgi:gamma-glutamyltranspeptidase/glutathione hydrolase
MPTVIATRDGTFRLAIGSPGGHGITQTVPQALLNIIEFGMDIQSAIEAPRFRLMPEYRSYPVKGVSMEIHAETRIPAEVLKALQARGHKVVPFEPWDAGVGAMSGIVVHPQSGIYMGGADPRRQYAAVAW